MIELDDRLTALDEQAREFADEIRPHGLELDRDPAAIHRMLDLTVVRRIATLQIPPSHQPDPLVVGRHRFHLMSAVERAVFMMRLAQGDLGIVLAAPGAPMAGLAVALLGDEAQQDWFYGRLLAEPTWAFFALTEPQGGSDASGMRTTLTRSDGENRRLDGVKRYVGNALRARIGVTFARTGTGPLAATAVLVDTEDPGFTAEPVATLGLRGVELGQITFDRMTIGPGRVLGRHLPLTRRGLWGWLRTFNLLRPTVAAMGVGVASAAYDYVVANRRCLRQAEQDRLDRMRMRIESVRRLTLRAAIAADADPAAGELSSAAKKSAAELAERCTGQALRFFGGSAMLDHPYLDKLARDARGIEFMEGTGNVQRLAVFTALTRRGTGQ